MTSRIFVALLLFGLSPQTTFAQKASVGWKEYLGGPDSSHYSPLKQINASNVDKIEVAWTYPAPDAMSVFCPLVVDNIAYVSAKGGALVALDATTGKELWAHSFGIGAGMRSGISGQRGANYWESKDRKDRRIFVTSGGYLHAIHALTGQSVASFADNGKLDLKIEEGTFKDGEVSFTANGEMKGEKVSLKGTGKLSGDTIKGSVTFDRKGKSKTDSWEAKREKEEKKKD